MKISKTVLLQAWAGACALGVAGLLWYPAGGGEPAPPTPEPPYAGPERMMPPIDPAPKVILVMEDADPSGTPDQPTAPAPTLVGLVGGRQAYLRSASGEVERVRRGGVIDGWTLVAVGVRSVVVERDGTPQSLKLFARPEPAGTTPPPVQPSAPGQPAAALPPGAGLTPPAPAPR